MLAVEAFFILNQAHATVLVLIQVYLDIFVNRVSSLSKCYLSGSSLSFVL